MIESDSYETKEQHWERMKRWGQEGALALKEGRRLPSHLRPKIVPTLPSLMETLRQTKRFRIKQALSGKQADTSLVQQLKSENEFLRDQVKALQKELSESRERSDTLILNLTKNLEQSQRMLESSEMKRKQS
jgi:hypothetical protein